MLDRNTKVNDLVMYTGEYEFGIYKKLKYKKLLHDNIVRFLTAGGLYRIRELGLVHSSHFISTCKDRRFCKLSGIVNWFPCDIFTKNFETIIKSKYTLR